MFYPEESYAIYGAIFEVYRVLGNRLTEPYYQKALEHEFELRGIPAVSQKRIPALYKGKTIGQFYLDFLCYDKIVVELKSLPQIGTAEFHQVNNYLLSGGYNLGILVNFAEKGKVKPIHIIRNGANEFVVDEQEIEYLPKK